MQPFSELWQRIRTKPSSSCKTSWIGSIRSRVSPFRRRALASGRTPSEHSFWRSTAFVARAINGNDRILPFRSTLTNPGARRTNVPLARYDPHSSSQENRCARRGLPEPQPLAALEHTVFVEKRLFAAWYIASLPPRAYGSMRLEPGSGRERRRRSFLDTCTWFRVCLAVAAGRYGRLPVHRPEGHLERPYNRREF